MVTQEVTLEITQPLSYETRRAIHHLPLAERARAHYERPKKERLGSVTIAGFITQVEAACLDAFGNQRQFVAF